MLAPSNSLFWQKYSRIPTFFWVEKLQRPVFLWELIRVDVIRCVKFTGHHQSWTASLRRWKNGGKGRHSPFPYWVLVTFQGRTVKLRKGKMLFEPVQTNYVTHLLLLHHGWVVWNSMGYLPKVGFQKLLPKLSGKKKARLDWTMDVMNLKLLTTTFRVIPIPHFSRCHIQTIYTYLGRDECTFVR